MEKDLVPEHTAKDLGEILNTNLICDEHLKLYLPAYPVLVKSAAQSTFWHTLLTIHYKRFSF